MHFTVDDIVEDKLTTSIMACLKGALTAHHLTGTDVLDASSFGGESAQDIYQQVTRLVHNTEAMNDRYYSKTTRDAVAWARENLSATLTREQAEKAFEIIKNSIISANGYGFGKWSRPWESFKDKDELPRRKKLDPTKTWLGVEIEIGARSRDDMLWIRRHLLEDYDFATADREGGTYPVEATFSPVESNKILSPKSDLRRYYANVLSTDKVVGHRAGDGVGTHFNVSNPQTRKEGAGTLTLFVDEVINNIIRTDAVATRKLFGRMPYGRAFSRGFYMELKLFNSTRDISIFGWYVRVVRALVSRKNSDTVQQRVERLIRLSALSPIP